MRLDGFHPTALPTRSTRPATAPVEDVAIPKQSPELPLQAVTTQTVERAAAAGEYIPARQDSTQPVYGHANQALATYQSMANLKDSDSDSVFGVDLFV